MSSISAEFGSLPKTHLLVRLRARELQVNSHHKDWLISGSLGSFAVSCWEDRAPGAGPLAAVQVPFLFIKNGVWEFQKVEVLEASLVQPGHRIDVIMA